MPACAVRFSVDRLHSMEIAWKKILSSDGTFPRHCFRMRTAYLQCMVTWTRISNLHILMMKAIIGSFLMCPLAFTSPFVPILVNISTLLVPCAVQPILHYQRLPLVSLFWRRKVHTWSESLTLWFILRLWRWNACASLRRLWLQCWPVGVLRRYIYGLQTRWVASYISISDPWFGGGLQTNSYSRNSWGWASWCWRLIFFVPFSVQLGSSACKPSEHHLARFLNSSL